MRETRRSGAQTKIDRRTEREGGRVERGKKKGENWRNFFEKETEKNGHRARANSSRRDAPLQNPFLQYSPPWTSQKSRRLSPSTYGPAVEPRVFPFPSTIAILCGGTANEQKRRYIYRRRIFMSGLPSGCIVPREREREVESGVATQLAYRECPGATRRGEAPRKSSTRHEKSDNTKLVLERSCLRYR